LAASILFLALGAAAAPAAGGTDLEIRLEQLRSLKGAVRLCLTRNQAYFPDCKADPQGLRRSASAGGGIVLSGMAPGLYALSVVHDENGNGKLDKLGFVPREGFGFSNNPAIRFGPPSFQSVRFQIAPGHNRQSVRMRYLL
jgi:uncharacterized protein (DUF2141 family)